ncbi:ribosome maturation factor RimP [Helicobacter suis]|uniref:ribosome maturation factor RimP n=1 Tax=Helicobacter suis TaxID=104628 RepID=UPI0013D1BF6F|nr:ribosome maturation factor RimP [Helicobacter suis]
MDNTELENLLETTLKGMGCALYDVAFLKENKRDILRISIKALEGPTSLDICEEASLLISPLLDVHAPFKNAYTLEVSSIGLERSLSKLKHFKLSIGDLVECKTIENTRLKGVIQAVNGSSILLQCAEGLEDLPFENIKKAKTIFEFNTAKP